MIEIKAPDSSSFERFTKIFFAGSIEMGNAEKWQDRLTKELKDEKVIIFNPRRDDWDSSWVQDPTAGTQFHQQVTWELNHINQSDLVVFYFDPETQSPITLLELGVCLGKDKNVIVCCPDGYFRKGNVVIACNTVSHNYVEVHNTFEDMLSAIKNQLHPIMEPVQDSAENDEDASDVLTPSS